MNRETYVSPTIDVVELSLESAILTSSGTAIEESNNDGNFTSN